MSYYTSLSRIVANCFRHWSKQRGRFFDFSGVVGCCSQQPATTTRETANFCLCPAITHANTEPPVIRRPCPDHPTRALTFVNALAMRVSLELRLHPLSVASASSRRELKIQQSSALSGEHNTALRPQSRSSEERGACLCWQAVAAMLWHEIVRCSCCSAPASICSGLYVRKILTRK